MAAGASTVSVDGHDIKITNMTKVLYPETGTTKGEVLSYYAAIAIPLIAHARQRPATRKRWPDGVAAQPFFEKNLPSHAPDWVETTTLEHSDRDVRYPMINDTATLLWLVQQAALELHVPQWKAAPQTTSRHEAAPDRLVLDLDPGPPAGLEECCEVALAARAALAADGLDAFPVTSGSKGMQLYAYVGDRDDITDTSEYAKALAEQLGKQLPKLVISHMTRADRARKIFVDWSQNSSAKTTITPYSLRGRDHPTAAAPRTWDEVEAGGLTQLRFSEVLERFDDAGDLLELLLP